MYILDFLNKIKWDKKEDPKDYTIVYFDRIEETTKEIRFTAIKDIKEPFMILQRNNQEVNIPLHRITQVKKKGVVVWQR